MIKKTFAILSIAALCACAAQYDKNKFDLTSDTYYVSELSANDHKRDDGIRVVNITGKSTADTTLYYRVLWFDEDGSPLKSTLSKSTEAKVRAEQPFFWKSVAPNNSAKTYKVYVSGRVIEQ